MSQELGQQEFIDTTAKWGRDFVEVINPLEENSIMRFYFEPSQQPEPAPTNNGRYLTGYTAQPEPEPTMKTKIFPIANLEDSPPLYTAPPQREWVDLTDEEILKLFGVNGTADSDRNALAVLKDAHKLLEAIKEKNT